MKWYAVKKEYIDYLKKWDKKIPNVDYGNRMKCFIGVIFIKNDIEYFAPLTSFKEKFISMKNDIDFIVVNFANGDMVGHTGVFDAAVKAVEAVDHELGLILEVAKEKNYNIILTSDHGNCEMMKDEEGNTLTNHTVGDVYCFVIAENVKEVKTGSLNNIAPTVLKLMNLNIPSEMDEPLI